MGRSAHYVHRSHRSVIRQPRQESDIDTRDSVRLWRILGLLSRSEFPG